MKKILKQKKAKQEKRQIEVQKQTAQKQDSVQNKKQLDFLLEEHIVKLLQKTEKPKEKTIEDKVKKEKAEETKVKEKKQEKTSVHDSYSSFLKKEYASLDRASVYSQISISAFTGFIYRSNVVQNSDFYRHLESAIANEPNSERNLVSSEMMDEYARKFTLNFLFGTDMNNISVEAKEKMFNAMYDTTQKQIYLAKVELIGFGHEKTMHAQGYE